MKATPLEFGWLGGGAVEYVEEAFRVWVRNQMHQARGQVAKESNRFPVFQGEDYA